MDLKRNIGLKLLLIIVMMIQPTAFSYAMASMDHSQHQTSLSTGMGHDGDHAMNDAATNAQQQHHNHENSINSSMSNDCCNSAMCCPAAVADADTALKKQNTAFYLSLSLSSEGVLLPTETKPPRSI